MRRGIFSDLLTVTLAFGAAVTVIVGCLVLAGTLGGGKPVRVQALMPTTAALTKGARVTMSGAAVGRVVDVKRQGFGTLVEMDITDHEVLPIPSDSRTTLRQRTAVGENYVEIAPGRSTTPLSSDAVLPLSQTAEYVDVDQVLSVLQGPTRRHARELIQSAGGALDGQGAGLNRVLGGASQVVQSGGSVFDVLAQDRVSLSRLVRQYGALNVALAERGQAIRVVGDRGTVALQAVARRDDALRATLRELPSTLAQVKQSSGSVRETSQVATPVLNDARLALRDLDPAIAALEPTATQARATLGELDRAIPPLRDLLGDVRQDAPGLTKALPRVQGTICQVAPMLRYIRPYAKDLLAPVIGLGSATNSYDAIGHLVRLTPVINENSAVGLPDEVSQATRTLLRAGVLGTSTRLTWDPYPKPGQEGQRSAADLPDAGGPSSYAKTGYEFPHVTADC